LHIKMGICTCKHLSVSSSDPRLESCLIVNSKRETVPVLGPIAASPLAVRRAKLIKTQATDVASPSREEETLGFGQGSRVEAE